jgi:hypothetical protein
MSSSIAESLKILTESVYKRENQIYMEWEDDRGKLLRLYNNATSIIRDQENIITSNKTENDRLVEIHEKDVRTIALITKSYNDLIQRVREKNEASAAAITPTVLEAASETKNSTNNTSPKLTKPISSTSVEISTKTSASPKHVKPTSTSTAQIPIKMTASPTIVKPTSSKIHNTVRYVPPFADRAPLLKEGKLKFEIPVGKESIPRPLTDKDVNSANRLKVVVDDALKKDLTSRKRRNDDAAKYVEVVRKKNERECLPGFSCSGINTIVLYICSI